MEEKLSVAPMMDITDVHFRRILRSITKKTVLYTEMVVDETIIHSPRLDYYLGRDIEEQPSIIQLGGSNPERLGLAAEYCFNYPGQYGEINLNCGCPSNRVAKKCFGAQLMLDPENVRQICHEINKRISSRMTTSVKCRIGVDNKDSYDELKTFISTVHQSGVKKFIIHARKCILKGLTPKQNRDIPPLKYEVVHRLIQEFPDLQFVLNGGINELSQAKTHMSENYTFGEEVLPPVHGVMIGRAVYNNPLMLATADSQFYGVKDPGLSRREILLDYVDYCEKMQSYVDKSMNIKQKRVRDEEVSTSTVDDAFTTKCSTSIMLNSMRNIVCGMKGSPKFKQVLNDIYVDNVKGRKGFLYPDPRVIVEGAMEVLQQDELDAPVTIDIRQFSLASCNNGTSIVMDKNNDRDEPKDI